MDIRPEQVQPPVELAAGAETETQNGLLTRLGNLARNAYDSFQDWRERRQAIVMASLAMGGGLAGATAVEMAYNTSPAGAIAAAPGLVTPDTGAPSEQECIQAGTAKLQFPVKPAMWHAGIRIGDPRHAVSQTIRYSEAVPPMPEGCAPRYIRVQRGSWWMQNRDDLSKWQRPTADIMGGIWGNNGGGPATPTVWFYPSAWPDRAYNTCVSGHWLKTKFTIDAFVRDEDTHQKLGERRYTVPVAVHGNCKSAAASARWAAKAWKENAQQ